MSFSRSVAFSNVLYVTGASTDRWFIPTTGFGDNPDAGTTAQQLAQCKEMLVRMLTVPIHSDRQGCQRRHTTNW